MMYEELTDPNDVKIDKRRQTERLLADQQADPGREREGSIATFDTFAENVKDSKTKLFRSAALAVVIALLISVAIFAVFVFPVQMDEENYHGGFEGTLTKWKAAWNNEDLKEYIVTKWSQTWEKLNN